ncbi:ABC transporter permease [Natronolimnohabitans innermongolicus]|uniref:ABC transporter n=1 Tax=Natronolimnohabitans innermongolicus JCM 12255 TaxID=1227499 RepID=L9WPV9_9EURY|nr:ABC transporter permease [Natronolimnohabitans innermongolicus]ELY50383.1 ABC transporter [Natronolimnohabitans innermongolicus JCM 12255]
MNLGTVRLPEMPSLSMLRDRSTAKLLMAIGLGWLTIFFIVPVVVLLFESLNFGEGSLLENYSTALSGTYLRTLGRTMAYAFITTIVCLVLAYWIAYYIAFKAKRQMLMLGFVLLPLWVAIIIRYFGVSLFFLPTGPVQQTFGTDFGVLFSTTGVIVGLTSALLPFAILPIYNSLQSIDEELINASQVLGARPMSTLRTVIFPLSLSGVIASALFVYILAAGSFLAPAILGGPGDFMMANVIEQSFSYSIPLAAALSVVFTVALLILIGIFNHYANISEVLGDL